MLWVGFKPHHVSAEPNHGLVRSPVYLSSSVTASLELMPASSKTGLLLRNTEKLFSHGTLASPRPSNWMDESGFCNCEIASGTHCDSATTLKLEAES